MSTDEMNEESLNTGAARASAPARAARKVRELPSQVRRPWRATMRTVIVATLAFLPVLPHIAAAAEIDEMPFIAQFLAGTVVVNRVLTLPAVDKWLDTYLPWISADPYAGKHRLEDK